MRPPQGNLLEPLIPSVALQTHLNPLAERGLQVEKLLGIGGTSEVVLALDQHHKRFALKRLLGQYRHDRSRRDTILYEGVHLSLVNSSKIIRCYELLTLPLPSALIQTDVERDPSALPASELNEVALLLEYIEGVHLRSLLKLTQRNRQALQREEIASIIYDLSEGIRALHQAKRSQGRLCPITHGDLSPTNILLRLNGAATLIDLSSASSELNAHRDDRRPGKWAYLSPGLRNGEFEGPAGDLYAFGVIWFELVTGRVPPPDIKIYSSQLREAGWPKSWAHVVAGLLSNSIVRREEAFFHVKRNLLWGDDRDRHPELKKLARRSLAIRIHQAQAAQH